MADPFKMVIQRQLSCRVGQQQAMIHFSHILRNIDPCTLGIVVLLKSLRQLHVPQILMIMELQLLKHIDHFIHIDIPEMHLCPSKLRLLKYLQDFCILISRRDCIVIARKGNGPGSPADQIQLQHLIQRPLVHINRSRVQFMICLVFIHLRDHPGSEFLTAVFLRHFQAFIQNQLKPCLIHIPQAVIPRRKRRPGPGKPPGHPFYFLRIEQYRNDLPQVRKQSHIIHRQGHFRRSRPDMGQLNQQVIRIYNGIFTLHGKEPFRIYGNVLVKGLVRQDQIIDAFFSVSPCPPGLLPEGGPGSRIACEQRGIQLADVNPQFQRIGGDQSEQISVQHLPLNLLALQRRISAPVAGDSSAAPAAQECCSIQLVPGFL